MPIMGGFVEELGEGRGNNMLRNHHKQNGWESAVSKSECDRPLYDQPHWDRLLLLNFPNLPQSWHDPKLILEGCCLEYFSGL